ncbi:MAG: BON domain-containing protein [Caldimonas sp.]
MTPTLRRSLAALSIASLASAGLLAGCEQRTTTTQSPDGTSTTTATTTSIPANPASDATAEMKSTAKEVGNDVSQAMDKAGKETSQALTKAGNVIEDGAITAKVKTALLADPDVKGLKIDVDTRNGVVTLSGTVEKNANLDRAEKIARDTEGVKSVDNQLVVKA